MRNPVVPVVAWALAALGAAAGVGASVSVVRGVVADDPVEVLSSAQVDRLLGEPSAPLEGVVTVDVPSAIEKQSDGAGVGSQSSQVRPSRPNVSVAVVPSRQPPRVESLDEIESKSPDRPGDLTILETATSNLTSASPSAVAPSDSVALSAVEPTPTPVEAAPIATDPSPTPSDVTATMPMASQSPIPTETGISEPDPGADPTPSPSTSPSASTPSPTATETGEASPATDPTGGETDLNSSGSFN